LNLFGMEDLSTLDRSEIARRQLNNLLTSYADEADLFNEVVQNALDSVISAEERGLYTGEVEPMLTIIVGRRPESFHYLFVGDNGTGMSPDIAKNLTVPGYSAAKKKGKTLGYKGVGASYFFAASRRISLRTEDELGQSTQYTVRGSFSWIKDPEEPAPIIDEEFDVPDIVNAKFPAGRGTGLLYQFHEGVHPRSLDSLVIVGDGPERELRNWANFFAARTVLGSVSPLSSSPIKVKIILDKGVQSYEAIYEIDKYDIDSSKLGYPFPSAIVRTSGDAETIDNSPPEKRHTHARKYSAIRRRWNAEEIISTLTGLSDDSREKLEKHLQWVDGYLCYSTEVLAEANKRLGGRSNLLRHGMRIAVDGVPQGRSVDLSLTSSQGLDRQAHIMISFEGLELDLGRKISADEDIAKAVSEIGKRVVGILKEYRWAMKKPNRPDVTSDLDRWRAQIDSRAADSVYPVLSERFKLTPVFDVDPDNEQEVIALFVWLCTSGFLKGYRLRAISGFERYDSLVSIDTESPILRDTHDRLSIRTDDDTVSGENVVLEFKHQFIDLISDFDDKKKNPSEIDIVVCWQVTDINCGRGVLNPCYGEWGDHRPNYGASYIWHDENETSSIVVIALRNLILELLAAKEREIGLSGQGIDQLDRLSRHDRDAHV
jgi:hypothetical protein